MYQLIKRLKNTNFQIRIHIINKKDADLITRLYGLGRWYTGLLHLKFDVYI